MVGITSGALLAALQAQFDAARQGQVQGRDQGIRGLQQSAESGNSPNSLINGGISAGGIPGTATTGVSGNALIGGSAPLAGAVANGSPGSLFSTSGSEPGERGDLGAGVTGGDLELLLSILSGNPIAMAAAIAQAVSGQPASFGEAFALSQEQGREFGGAFGGPLIGGTTGLGTGTVNNIHSGFNGGSESQSSSGGGNSSQFDTPEFGV